MTLWYIVGWIIICGIIALVIIDYRCINADKIKKNKERARLRAKNMLFQQISGTVSIFQKGTNTIVKRIGFIIFSVFLLVLLLSLIQSEGRYFIKSITFSKYQSNSVIGISFYGTIVGFLMSFGYDFFLAKIINWVKMK